MQTTKHAVNNVIATTVKSAEHYIVHASRLRQNGSGLALRGNRQRPIGL